jgi:hypothetical protein
LRRIAGYFLTLSLLGLAIASPAQSSPTAANKSTVTLVKNVHVFSGKDGPVVGILADHPIVPAINKIEDPPRLVIDLPGSRLADAKKNIEFHSELVAEVRARQFQDTPPITRIVIDLLKPITYSWDAAGNRLMIRLHASEAPPAQEASVPSTAPAVATPALVPATPANSGAIVFAESRLAAGSSLTAGTEAAILRLSRGGEVRVCPGTTVSVTSSQSGHSLMLGMSTGALEANYKLSASADSILTPDFRILLAGPGEFHYAISADSRGNTCVRALPGNSASVIVSELLGDGTYQVKPGEQVVFRSGRLNVTDSAVPSDCGCPAPAAPVAVASANPPPEIKPSDLAGKVPLAQPGDRPPSIASASDQKPAPQNTAISTSPAAGTQPQATVVPPESAPLPPSKPNDVHVQVDAPFVFRASDLPPAAASKPVTPPLPTPATPSASSLPVARPSRPAVFQTNVIPPSSNASQPRKGFFGKMKGFFVKVFT